MSPRVSAPLALLTPKQLNQIQAHIITTPKPNLLNSLLQTLTKVSNNPQNALVLYTQMVKNPTSHDHFTYTYAIKASSLLHDFHRGCEVHARAVKSGCGTDIFIENSLIRFYADMGEVVSARKVFDRMLFRNIVSWTSFVSGLVKNGCGVEALVVFGSIDVKPNVMTLVSVLSACCQLRGFNMGKAVHGYYMRNFYGENVIVDNAILNLYFGCGSVSSARNMFEKMRQRDVVSWTTMIDGYAKNGWFEEAVSVFNEMVHGSEELEPNEATLVTVLSVCASQGSLSLGAWVHSYIIERERRLSMDGYVGNALMNMYTKCGEMGKALNVFNELKSKDLLSWSILIGGMALNGYGKQALQVFSLMLVNGIYPDDVVFVGLLSACSHGRMINTGLVLFKAMKDVYGITPEVKHFACIVDMYSRAGYLVEAEKFITNMPVEPDAAVWGALMSAYKLHGDEEACERIGRWLVKTKGAGAGVGTYRLLSNMYASMNRWNDAQNVEEMIRFRDERKTPGCSWIERQQP